MRGEDERRAVTQQPRVRLREAEPLQVDDVGARRGQPHQPDGVLGDLQRQTQPRAAEEPRGERIEELSPLVAVRLRNVAEAEARGDELDVRARAGERGPKRMVVRRREGGWIGDDDAHRS